MKRALPFIPIVLFIFLIACGPVAQTFVSPEMGTWVALTQTAAVVTPSLTPTPNNIYSSALVGILNAGLPEDQYLRRVEELENTIGAQYPVVDVTFPVVDGVTIFQVRVHCQCAAPVACCNPERMFVEIIRKMEHNSAAIQAYVSYVPAPPVGRLQVFCIDHGEQLGIMAASWQDVKDFLNEQISGSQFGSRIRRE